VITGDITLTGISASDLTSNATLETAVQAGIASSVGVPASEVALTVSAARRLARQLTSGAKVAYTITVPPSSSVTASTIMSTLGSGTIATTLQSHIQTQLAAVGHPVTITVTAVTASQTSSSSAKASGANHIMSAVPLAFVFLAAM